MKNRSTLSKWFYDVHEKVNEKLEVDYAIDYDKDVVPKYESFRAQCNKSLQTTVIKGCVSPLNYKAFSFKKLYTLDAPVLQLSFVEPFISIAKQQGLPDHHFAFIELARNLNGDIKIIKDQQCWYKRNYICQLIIRHMRENAIECIDNSGIPSKYELLLLMYMCSNLNRTEILNITAKI